MASHSRHNELDIGMGIGTFWSRVNVQGTMTVLSTQQLEGAQD